MTVNIGLIGLGMIGRDHLQRFQTVIQNARVSAVCDINRNVTDTIAREYGAQPYYDAVEMIQSDDVDAIRSIKNKFWPPSRQVNRCFAKSR